MNKKIILAIPLILSACGTVFSGSSQSITFDSNVKQGIQIYADGALICNKTPCVVDVDRHSGPMTITAKANGYEDAIMQNKTKINPIFWVNILPYGSTTDFATGAMWKYSQEGVYINMEKKNKTIAEAKQFKQDSAIRHFALYSYSELKIGNPEYITALEELTGKSEQELNIIIANSNTEADLANKLTNI